MQARFGAEDRLAAPVLPGQDEELRGEIVEVDVPRHAVPQRRGRPVPVRILVGQAPTDVGAEAFREDLKDDVEDRLPIIGRGTVLALGNGCA
ncbi:triosephosphate isomerase [Actinomyces sp. Chiba101]|nr:triosephosphate isomerase [Actinomyces sp. Chiba101]